MNRTTFPAEWLYPGGTSGTVRSHFPQVITEGPRSTPAMATRKLRKTPRDQSCTCRRAAVPATLNFVRSFHTGREPATRQGSEHQRWEPT